VRPYIIASLSGADVVKESLRRLCIWDLYGKATGKQEGVGLPFWDYLAQFNDRCRDTGYFNNVDCVNDAYKHSKIDSKKVDECMVSSGGTEDNKINTRLSAEIVAQEQRGVVVIPSAFVNTAAIRGALTPTNVFSAICAGFSAGTQPDVCIQCGACSDAPGCVAAGYCKAGTINGASAPRPGVSTHTFVSSMFLVVALFGSLGVWHYKRTQEGMRDQVRGILADYLPLEDQEPMGNNNSHMSNSNSRGGGGPMDFARGLVS
jgi:hypothetical protein